MTFVWPVDRTCLPLPELGDEPTPEEQADYDRKVAQRNAAEDLAVHVLWALSGRQFGLWETTARPCASYVPGFGNSAYVHVRHSGCWSTWPCGCVGACRVAGPRVVHLPGPVAEVTEVSINGAVLAPAGYMLEGDALYRMGGAAWPVQDLGRPLGETGTWSVTYLRGVPVPPGVEKLTAELAKEFITACDGEEDRCRLPRTLVGRTRNGSVHSFDPSKILAAGKTGLAEVDLWLAAVNPNHLPQDAEVL